MKKLVKSFIYSTIKTGKRDSGIPPGLVESTVSEEKKDAIMIICRMRMIRGGRKQ